MRNKQKGFSLIELLIVVAIILIIAAIAIPNLLRSKMAANEASAVASLAHVEYVHRGCIRPPTPHDPTDSGQLWAHRPRRLPPLADLVDNLLGVDRRTVKSGYTIHLYAGAPAKAASRRTRLSATPTVKTDWSAVRSSPTRVV